MATIHNEAEPEQIAPVVLMPGDPLRAKLIAEEYLENCILQIFLCNQHTV